MDEIIKNLPEESKKLIAEMKERMAEGLANTRGYTEPGYKGYRYPMMFSSDATKMLYEDYEFLENTVILSSYPKTGTHWLSEILRQILFGQDEKLDAIIKLIPPPLFLFEGWKAEKMEIWKHIPLPHKMFMSHLPAPLINLERVKKSNSKVIVPIRNPKDQAVSWYHFTQGPSFEPIREHLSPDWPQFFSDYIQGKQPVPVTKPGEGYAEFLRGWDEYKNDANVLFVYFENMKKDPAAEIARLAKFLNMDLTVEQISTIKEKTSFSAMKANQESGSDDIGKMRKDINLVRKGKVGSWKDTFTVAQSEMMDEMMAKKLDGTDIKFIY